MKSPLTLKSAAAAVLVAAVLAVAGHSQSQGTAILRGKVVDAKEQAVAGASVRVEPGGKCTSDDDGAFACEVPDSGRALLFVKADGFRTEEREITLPADTADEVLVRLEILPLREEVVVSAAGSATTIGDTPASVISFDERQIAVTAATGLDDVLRQAPGFTLFRRTTSRTANPTTQGASLRGINPSGASRSLVLVDGLPVNDPFGGWVPWASIPPASVESVEVLRGGASSLYGSDSVGGTISVVRRGIPAGSAFSAEGYGGSQGTAGGSAFGGRKFGLFAFDAIGSLFRTEGYVPVEQQSRGSADERAGSGNGYFSLRSAFDVENWLRAFVRVSLFKEARQNGTLLQRNRTYTRRLEAGADPVMDDIFSGASQTKLSIRAFGQLQVFDQTFSAVSAERNSESLVRVQRVPSQSVGFSLRFSTLVQNNSLLAGVEFDETRGTSDETGFFGGRATSGSGSGGREHALGVYLQDLIAVGERVVVSGRVRYDRWKNLRGLRYEVRLSDGMAALTKFPDRSEEAWSPGISASFRVRDNVSVYAGISASFRAPTLNELYRGFRVGDVVTLPNENLRAERSTNAEGGASFWGRNFSVRTGLSTTWISDSVTNVTIDASGSPIIRQRQNAAKVRVTGFEIDTEFRRGPLSFAAGYLASSAVFSRFPLQPELENNRLPQSPAQGATFRFSYRENSGHSVGLQARVSSSQFDDDLNLFRLGSYFQMDAFGSLRLAEKLALFVAGENLFNLRYDAGVTPVRTVAAPFTVRAGLRWN